MFKNLNPNPMVENLEDVGVQEVLENKKQVHLLDVRRPDEWSGELGHVAEAQLICLDELEDRISDIPKDKPLVVICRSGQRSARASAFLKENGFSEVYNMLGGMIAWNESGFDTVTE